MSRVNLDEAETEVDDDDIAWGDEGEPDEDEPQSGAIISINGKVMGNLDDLVKQPTEEFKDAMRGIVERAMPKVDPEIESIFSLARRKMAIAQKEGVELLNFAQIRADGATQMRAGLNAETVNEYADIFYTTMTDWWPFPPLTVFDDGETYWLADGFHRFEAFQRHHHIKNNHEAVRPVPVLVHKGTRRDAILYAAGANADHGLRRTNADKRKAVEVVLKDEEWRQWSDTEIARRCKVDPKTVASVRQKLDSTMEIHSEMRRKTADGRTMNVENIGRKAEPETRLPVWELERRIDTFANQEANPHDGRSSDDVVDALKSQAKSPVKSGTFLERLVQSIPEWHSRNDLIQAINNVADQRRQRANQATAKKVYLPPEQKHAHIPFAPIAGGSIVGTNLSIGSEPKATTAPQLPDSFVNDLVHAHMDSETFRFALRSATIEQLDAALGHISPETKRDRFLRVGNRRELLRMAKDAQMVDEVIEAAMPRIATEPQPEPTTPRAGTVEVLANDASPILLAQAFDEATMAELDAAVDQLFGEKGARAQERRVLLGMIRREKMKQLPAPPIEAIRILVNVGERSQGQGSLQAAGEVRQWLDKVSA